MTDQPFIQAHDDDLEPAGAPAAGVDERDPSVAGGKPVTPDVLASLVAEITGDVELVPLRLKTPREGWSIELRTDVEEDDLDKFGKLADRKRAKRGGQPRPRVGIGREETDISEVRMSALLLATYNTGIFRRGEPLVDGDGDPLTLRSREMHELLGINAGDPFPSATAVRKLYGGLEGQIIAAGRALMGAAGYLSDAAEDDDDAEGPTSS